MSAHDTPLQPLTHHEILGLVEPFTRRGRSVDLAASQRQARRLAFKPIAHGDAVPGLPGLMEGLRLDNPEPGRFALLRTLTLPSGLAATLLAEGASPGELLAAIEAVPLARGFVCGPRHVLAMVHRLASAELALLRAEARLGGYTLHLTMSEIRGVPAALSLHGPPGPGGAAVELPEDLLAVLGWPWTRLLKVGDEWQASLRLKRREPARSRAVERQLALTVQHLARTLAEPPPRFHDRLWLARWRVTGRRAVPALVSLLLIAAAASVSKLQLSEESLLMMMTLNLPPAMLLMFFFGAREIPRIEIPPLPRRLPPNAWPVLPPDAPRA
jgi:hypothetical protein